MSMATAECQAIVGGRVSGRSHCRPVDDRGAHASSSSASTISMTSDALDSGRMAAGALAQTLRRLERLRLRLFRLPVAAALDALAPPSFVWLMAECDERARASAVARAGGRVQGASDRRAVGSMSGRESTPPTRRTCRTLDGRKAACDLDRCSRHEEEQRKSKTLVG